MEFEVIQAVPPWFFSTVEFVMGAVVGSFLNVCIHRMPRNESLVAPRSHCPSCGHAIRWFDNIPLLSFIALGGKCRDCGAKFSIRYWIVELLTASLFLLIWRNFSPLDAIPYTIFVSALIAASFIDIEHFIIPDEITIGGVVAGVFLSGIFPNLQGESRHFSGFLWSLMGALAGFVALWCVMELGKKAFGTKKVVLEKSTEVLLTGEGIQIEGQMDRWDEIFSRSNDHLWFEGEEVKIGNKSLEKARIAVNGREIRVAEETFLLEEIGELKASTRAIMVPREAMGFGDVKFIAALGAFLGPKSIFFIILVSSVAGSVVGLGSILVGKKQWGMKIPYGPYLALGALVWLFWGMHWTIFDLGNGGYPR